MTTNIAMSNICKTYTVWMHLNMHMYRKRIPFSVCADNSMFTVYAFFAQNVNLATVFMNEQNEPILQLQEPRYTVTVSVNLQSNIAHCRNREPKKV